MVVLDTHALYWWVNQTAGKLARNQVDSIEAADSLGISSMTCWEMAWLVTHDRIELKIPIASWLDQVEESGIAVIPVSRAIAMRAVALPEHHKDPVDRLIIATALEYQARLISVDARFPDYVELTELLVKP
jgi:PIN domain nuclease of toxin-antitoxin system